VLQRNHKLIYKVIESVQITNRILRTHRLSRFRST